MQGNEPNDNEKYEYQCPSCKEGTIRLYKTVYNLPDGDKMLIIKFECNKCNFRTNDVIPLTTRIEPGIMELKVTSEKDLRSKIYRSPVGKLEIPELGLEVQPGPSAEFYYTNIEGILDRFKRATSIYLNDLSENDPEKEKIKDLLNKIELAMKGKLNFTIRLIDIGGGSYIIPIDETKFKFIKFNNKDS